MKSECGGRRQEPIFNDAIRDSLVLAGIVGNDDQPKGSSMSGDQQVVRTNCCALLFQHASDVAIVPVSVYVERQDLDVIEDCFVSLEEPIFSAP